MLTSVAESLVFETAKWVDQLAPWKVFATHTFSWEASLWSARRVYERFMDSALPGVSYFYAIEQNPSRDGHHVHAMWDSSEAPRKATHRDWLKRYGRNRIEPVRDFGDVVLYCSKYVVKEGAWWDFHLSRARYENARRVKNPSHFPLEGFSGSSERDLLGHGGQQSV